MSENQHNGCLRTGRPWNSPGTAHGQSSVTFSFGICFKGSLACCSAHAATPPPPEQQQSEDRVQSSGMPLLHASGPVSPSIGGKRNCSRKHKRQVAACGNKPCRRCESRGTWPRPVRFVAKRSRMHLRATFRPFHSVDNVSRCQAKDPARLRGLLRVSSGPSTSLLS